MSMLHAGAVTLAALFMATPAMAADCHAIHGVLHEQRVTQGCDPGLAFCFLGEISANQELRGTTHFRGDSAAAGPATGLPGFVSYSGPFQYRLAGGTLDTRETGVTNPRKGVAGSGVVTAYQHVTGGTGDYAGATGYFFVSGTNIDGQVDTVVDGELCVDRSAKP